MEKSGQKDQKEEFIELCHSYINQLSAFRAEVTNTILPMLSTGEVDKAGAMFLYRFCRRFAAAMRAFSTSGSMHEEALSLTPWRNKAHFSHNIGTSAFLCFTQCACDLALSIYNREASSVQVFKKFLTMVENLPYFFDQLAAHLESACLLLTDADKCSEIASSSKVIDALRVVLRSRILYGLRIAGVSDEGYESAPSARVICDEGLESDIPLSELVELFYVPVSNAHRIMAQEDNPDKLRLDVTGRKIEYEGISCTVIEFFNTGPLVDINALSRKLIHLSDRKLADAPQFAPIISAIKQGSKQARLDVNEDILVLDGLTLTSGGSGIGLNDIKRHIELRGGVLLLNNVYGPEEGFCCTLILPDGDVPTGGMNEKLRKLKELLQTGQYFLPKVEHEADLAA